MEKRQRKVKLSSVLLLASVRMLLCMALLCACWLAGVSWLERAGIVYHGSEANRQTEEFLAGNPAEFRTPKEGFLGEYVLFGSGGEVLEQNVGEKELKAFRRMYEEKVVPTGVKKYEYPDKSTIVIRWHYRKEFVNPALRKMLPPAESLLLAGLGAALVLCVFINTLVLCRKLSKKLALFKEVSRKIGSRDLDFEMPAAGIREYDQALDAMDQMRNALYRSLSQQWAAQREREGEMAALAHDLKTPLTLAAGNAELMLEEELSDECRKRTQTILSGCRRAQKYVADLLETAAGTDETEETVSLPGLFEELIRHMEPLARSCGVSLKVQNRLKGTAFLQKDRMLRALGNLVQNAVEHSPKGGTVYLEGETDAENREWRITVQDEGGGFSRAALVHGTERLWRDDQARMFDGHNGLGLWSASRTLKAHNGSLTLENQNGGARVTASAGCIVI